MAVVLKKPDGTRVVNIGGDPHDINFRYQMPPIEAKVEGRGNGIKTRIVNMMDVAKAMQRPPEYPTKWFGAELGAQTTASSAKRDFIVNGVHTAEELQNSLVGFIRAFVLCPNCKKPETVLRVSAGNKKQLTSTCRSCGAVVDLPTSHRCGQYILNNPPRHNADQQAMNRQAEVAASVAETEEERRRQLAKQRKAGKAKKESTVPTTTDWALDTSLAAVEARRTDQLSDAMRMATVSAADDKVFSQIAEAVQPKHTDVTQVVERVKNITEGVKLNRETLISTVVQTRFSKHIMKELMPNLPLLAFLVNDARSRALLIGQLEILMVREKLFAEFRDALYVLEEREVLDDASIFLWYDQGNSKTVDLESYQELRASAMQLVNWLRQNSDDESEDEEEEEDDIKEVSAAEVGLEEDSSAPVDKPKQPAAPVDDDFEADIDAL